MKKRNLFIIFTIFCLSFLTSCLTSNVPQKEDFIFEDQIVEYDGTIHSLELKGSLPYGFEIVYPNGNEFSDPGEYKILANIINTESEKVVLSYEAMLTIIDNLDVEFLSHTFTYDGTEHSLAIEGLEELNVVYVNNGQTEVGKYYVTAEIYNDDDVVIKKLYAILTIEYPQNEDFEAFCENFLKLILEDDQMTINFYFNNPENFGLEHYEGKLTTFEKSENYEEELNEVRELLAELQNFKNEKLTSEETKTYEVIERYLEYVLSFKENMMYMTNSYLGSYLGYQSNLPLELCEYKFRNEQDIKDFIGYLQTSYDAFVSYVEFTKEQINYGYAMPDFVIDNVIEQCEKFISLGEDNFLIGIFNEKIENLTFELSTEAKEQYKAQVKEEVLTTLTQSYQYVANTLAELKGNATVYGGLAMYGQDGVDNYRNQLSYVLGLKNLNVDELYEHVYASLEETIEDIYAVLDDLQNLPQSELMEAYYILLGINELNYSDLSYDELLNYFKEISQSLVPTIEEMPEISIKRVPVALQENYSPASYFVSPIDETKYESIYLNPLYEDDYNYIFTTLAHEGYPGHLYQNVYTKQLEINNLRKLLKCSGYTEGWATYVEMRSYYFAQNYASENLQLVLEYNALNNRFSLLLNAILDIAIHYYGMNLEDIVSLTNEITGNEYEEADLKAAYEQLIEIPTNMCMYSVSYLYLDDLHEYAMSVLGDNFDEIAFNKVLLDDGSAPLDIVIKNVYHYLNDQLFIISGEEPNLGA